MGSGLSPHSEKTAARSPRKPSKEDIGQTFKKPCAQYQAVKAELEIKAADILSELKEANADLERADDKVRDIAVASFHISGDKHPHQSIEVKVVTQLEYDPNHALKWAIERIQHPDCWMWLFLDFDKVVVEVQTL